MTKIYSGYVTAQKHRSLGVLYVIIKAADEQEAQSSAREYGLKEYPTDTGWTNHEVGIQEEIPADWIAESYLAGKVRK